MWEQTAPPSSDGEDACRLRSRCTASPAGTAGSRNSLSVAVTRVGASRQILSAGWPARRWRHRDSWLPRAHPGKTGAGRGRPLSEVPGPQGRGRAEPAQGTAGWALGNFGRSGFWQSGLRAAPSAASSKEPKTNSWACCWDPLEPSRDRAARNGGGARILGRGACSRVARTRASQVQLVLESAVPHLLRPGCGGLGAMSI